MQRNADYAAEWAVMTVMKLKAEKTVELLFSFVVPPANFPPIVIDGRSDNCAGEICKVTRIDYQCGPQVGPPCTLNAQQSQPAGVRALSSQEEWCGTPGASEYVPIHHPSHPWIRLPSVAFLHDAETGWGHWEGPEVTRSPASPSGLSTMEPCCSCLACRACHRGVLTSTRSCTWRVNRLQAELCCQTRPYSELLRRQQRLETISEMATTGT